MESRRGVREELTRQPFTMLPRSTGRWGQGPASRRTPPDLRAWPQACPTLPDAGTCSLQFGRHWYLPPRSPRCQTPSWHRDPPREDRVPATAAAGSSHQRMCAPGHRHHHETWLCNRRPTEPVPSGTCSESTHTCWHSESQGHLHPSTCTNGGTWESAE